MENSDKAKTLTKPSFLEKSQYVPPKCTVCGSHFALNEFALDERFWSKSATYLELKEAAFSCSWCYILKTVVERCIGHSTEVLALAGYVDWGKDPFYPIWYGSDEVVELEIFCTAGKQLTVSMCYTLHPLTIIKISNGHPGCPPYQLRRGLSLIRPATTLYERRWDGLLSAYHFTRYVQCLCSM
jgi:hypothetical protein